ncbi:MAG TPA: hypothetical protein VKR56_01530 [Candidatus Cybelea sp.]|nr:hypothetical protein [Candidatus Cybelea sp.]
MRVWSKRLPFCLAVAVMAAAVADPIVEFASNAGWFGPGNFTDRSNLDVFPALMVGIGVLALYLVGAARAVLAGTALPRRLVSLAPAIFALQIVALYVMETAEQFIVGGHALGPTMWLGGPIAASLAIHAAFCVTVTFWISRSARGLAQTTLRVLRLIKTTATFAAHAFEILLPRRCDERTFRQLVPVLCRIGERAPPLLPR